jgi:hypothetical protein
MEKAKVKYGKDLFNENMGQTWTTLLSNGDEVELIPNGKSEYVDFDRVEEFNQAVLDARLKECEKQIDAVKNGFNYIFPLSITSILTA